MSERKKLRIKVMALLLVSFLMVPTVKIQAASKKKEALKAYAAVLESKENKAGNYNQGKFALAYIDKNKVPELVYIYGSRTYGGEMYSYQNGSVRQNVVPAFMLYGYYKKKGVILASHTHANVVSGEAMEVMYYLKYSKGKFPIKLSRVKSYLWKSGRKKNLSVTYCNVKNKEISKSKFKSQLKKMAGSGKAMKFRFYDNTSTNRAKYLR